MRSFSLRAPRKLWPAISGAYISTHPRHGNLQRAISSPKDPAEKPSTTQKDKLIGPSIENALEYRAKIEASIAYEKALKKKHGCEETGLNPGYFIEENQDWYMKEGWKNWGWAIYRTCYDSEEDWAIFKSEFRRLLLYDMRDFFTIKEVECRSKYIEPLYEDDRKQFEAASKVQLRQHFRAYLASARLLLDQGVASPSYEPCHQFFLVADADSIASVVNAKGNHVACHDGMPWINVVEADWPPTWDPKTEPKEARWDYHQRDEPVEGLRTYEVGFHRNAIQTLYPGFWMYSGDLPDMWYVRPPGISWND